MKKLIKENSIILKFLNILFIFLIFKYQHKIIDSYRILVYSCCDEIYSHYIPIFCDTILRSDKLKKIDIEIGVNLKKLSDNEEKAINYLKKKYSSQIKINYNVFIKNKTGTFFNNIKVHTGSVRFLSQPSIRNKYVYITDVDMFVLTDNFYLYLIRDMIKRKSCYSNIVRKNKKLLTGLHFILYDSYYPINKLNNYSIQDEALLFNLMKSKRIKIDYETVFRPVFGIHASPNRPTVKTSKIVGWGAEDYKFKWIEYCESETYNYIYPLLDKFVKEKIFKLNLFYNITNNITSKL